MDWLAWGAGIATTVGTGSLSVIAAAAIVAARSFARMERTIFGDAKAKQLGLIDRMLTLEEQAKDWDRRRGA
jgi:hypothetical protein